MAERRHSARRLAAAASLLLLLQIGARAAENDADAADGRWYQVEIVLFANESAASRTTEVLTTADAPHQRAVAVALGPAWPGSVRPEHTGELEMLWDSPWNAPRLDVVPSGLDPETMELMRWLDRLRGRPDLAFLEDVDRIEWNPEAPSIVPVPPIRPAVEWTASAPEADGPDGTDSAAPPEPEDIPIPVDLAFRVVEPEQLLLAEEAARLRRARDFRVLDHLAWRQPFRTEAPAIPVAVRVDDPDDDLPRVAGSIGIELRRYLHVDFDLAWREEAELDALGETRWLWAPMIQSRRMRSGETHYVDHPRIGALVRITPFRLAEPLAEDGPPAPAFED